MSPLLSRLRSKLGTSRYSHLSTDGTGAIVVGSLVAGIAAYAYQFLGGQSLGVEAFAPVSVLLTLHFLVFIVVLIPIEQLVIRRLTLDEAASDIPRRVIYLVGSLAVAVGLVGWFASDQLFRGDRRFAWFAVASLVSHFVFVIWRGRLAGYRRFRSYGVLSGAASVLRFAIAGAALLVRPSASGLAIALIVGPLVSLVWRPKPAPEDPHSRLSGNEASTLDESGLLSGLILAAAASQVLLLAGPLVVSALDGTEAQISIAFAVFTLSRAPLTFGYNLLARVLPPFTEMAARGQRSELRAWARGMGYAALALSLGAFAFGWLTGPSLVQFAFGDGFRPESHVVALVAAGVVLSGAGLFVGQVLVARGEPLVLATAWVAGIAAGAVALTLLPGSVLDRVAGSFVAGEVAALGLLVVGAAAARPGESTGYGVTKRTIDIAISLIVGVVALPVILAAAVAIRLDSRGPALFRQERIGRDGRPFGLIKLRSMGLDEGEQVFVEHIEDLKAGSSDLRIRFDPRVTRVGRLLRATSIDELPNLWNVLRGSMSLVGPRPLVRAEAELIGLSHARFTVKPGVTGLAQISGRDEIDLESRSHLDAQYVAQRGPGLDARILARTIFTVLRGAGR